MNNLGTAKGFYKIESGVFERDGKYGAFIKIVGHDDSQPIMLENDKRFDTIDETSAFAKEEALKLANNISSQLDNAIVTEGNLE